MGKHDIGSKHNRRHLSSELGYDREVAVISTWPKRSGKYHCSEPKSELKENLVTEEEFFVMRRKIGGSYEV
nr:MAG TPA: hypothetical protein [Caudoviricetes sp.]